MFASQNAVMQRAAIPTNTQRHVMITFPLLACMHAWLEQVRNKRIDCTNLRFRATYLLLSQENPTYIAKIELVYISILDNFFLSTCFNKQVTSMLTTREDSSPEIEH